MRTVTEFDIAPNSETTEISSRKCSAFIKYAMLDEKLSTLPSQENIRINFEFIHRHKTVAAAINSIYSFNTKRKILVVVGYQWIIQFDKIVTNTDACNYVWWKRNEFNIHTVATVVFDLHWKEIFEKGNYETIVFMDNKELPFQHYYNVYRDEVLEAIENYKGKKVFIN